jgi:hypothetical protein
MAPAKTGRDRSRRTVVILTDQTNNGIRSIRRPFTRRLITVEIKFIEPKMEDAPAK